MGVTIISEENISEYMQILTSDEIFGINEDRLTSFVISDDEKDEIAGVMTVQIFPEYIRLERIFILPEFRHRGYASRLLEIIKDRPGDARLPIRAFPEDKGDVSGLLESSGFTEKENRYCVLSAYLKDWIDIGQKILRKMPEDIKKKIMIYNLDQVPEQLIREFVLRSPHDEILQFPDRMTDVERFSDVSMISMMDNTIKAASLVEETEDYTQFTWCYGEDRYAMLANMFMVRKEMGSEYSPDYRIRCVCSNEHTAEGYKKMFSACDIKKIYMYQFD